MNRKLWNRFGLMATLTAVLFVAATGAEAHRDVTLRDEAGDPITVGADVPVSMKMTCGGEAMECHDYDTITGGYHFQQGFDEIIADAARLAGEKPYLKTPGMYGKW